MNWEDAVKTLLDDPEQRDFVRQCYFDFPLIQAAERFYFSNEWSSVRTKVPISGNARALDVGAGNGIVTYALARDGWEVTAVEPDASVIVGCGAIRQLVKEAGLSVNIFEGLTDDLDVPLGWFDAIFVRQVFHHALDIEKFALGLAKLLKPGGALITWRDHVISKSSDLNKFFDRHPLHHLYGGENAFRECEYAAALTSAGLKIFSVYRHFDDPMNYGPLSPREVFEQAAGHFLPVSVGQRVAAVLGNYEVFQRIKPLLSVVDRRPGRLVSFLSYKDE